MLKQVLWFAQRNKYDLTYVTAYPKHAFLIDLLDYYGFRQLWRRLAPDQKNKKDHTLPLNTGAVHLLVTIRDETLARDGQLGEFVFPSSESKSRHIANIYKTWLIILKNAKIEDLHIHDLRHHFASQLASSGSSLALIGKLLGHRSLASTSRYARF